ncbi:MAG: hypothetical protein OXB86_06640 [Bdellovibrionales bacterium]|nr:hypothetical protein [Bdellovibrionales bacterium]
MRFATKRLIAAFVSKPNSLLAPSLLLMEGVIFLSSEKTAKFKPDQYN